MEFDVTLLGIVIGMMVLANRLVAMLVTPIFDKYGWDKFWLAYPAWILAGGVASAVLGAVWPALRASRQPPVVTLRYE